MARLSQAIGTRFTRKILDYVSVDISQVDMNWRTRPCRERYRDSSYGKVAQWPHVVLYGQYKPLRELGESLLIQLIGSDRSLDDESLDLLTTGLTTVDYDKVCTIGMIYPLAAYWRYRANLTHDL